MDTELNYAIMAQMEFQYKFLERTSNNTRFNEVLKKGFSPKYSLIIKTKNWFKTND